MAWIDVIEEDQATGKLKSSYDQIKKRLGEVPNLLKVYSLNPQALSRQMDLYGTVMFGPSGPTGPQQELLATVVSSLNGCEYCVRHHGEALNLYWQDEAKLDRLIADYTQLDLSDQDRAMLDYAVKLTKQPDSVSKDDVQRLRDAGFSDESILNIAVITGLFNAVNRVVDGLSVELSGEDVKTMKTNEIKGTQKR